jgi:hypothetical protein
MRGVRSSDFGGAVTLATVVLGALVVAVSAMGSGVVAGGGREVVTVGVGGGVPAATVAGFEGGLFDFVWPTK